MRLRRIFLLQPAPRKRPAASPSLRSIAIASSKFSSRAALHRAARSRTPREHRLYNFPRQRWSFRIQLSRVTQLQPRFVLFACATRWSRPSAHRESSLRVHPKSFCVAHLVRRTRSRALFSALPHTRELFPQPRPSLLPLRVAPFCRAARSAITFVIGLKNAQRRNK